MPGLGGRAIASVFSALLLVGACSGKSKPAEDPVLARVNGSAITLSELNAAAERSFGADRELNQTRRKGVLESLVLSRAIALAREKELDEAGKRALERKVAAYREEVLVRDYLAQHLRPERVTTAQAEQYYRAHPERFGAGQVSRYELIATERELTTQEREAVLRALAQASDHDDWGKWVAQLRAKGMPLALTVGRGNEGALHEQLRRLSLGRLPR